MRIIQIPQRGGYADARQFTNLEPRSLANFSIHGSRFVSPDGRKATADADPRGFALLWWDPGESDEGGGLCRHTV